MSQLKASTEFDDTLRAFLAWQADAVAGAPSADEMKRRIVAGQDVRVRLATSRRPVLRPAWIALILLFIVALVAATSYFAGRQLFNVPAPASPVVPSLGATPQTSLPASTAAAAAQPPFAGEIAVADSSGNLQAVDPATGGMQLLVACAGTCNGLSSPAWSPDGTQLAYLEVRASDSATERADPNEGIWVKDFTTGASRRLATCGEFTDCAADTPLAWSPDGSRLAYFQAGNVTVIGAGGGKPTVLIQDRAVMSFRLLDIGWSPDGQSVIYADDGARRAVHVDGSGVEDLPAPGSLYVEGSPDGTRLAYVVDLPTPLGSSGSPITGDRFTGELWVGAADGSGAVKVAEHPGCCLGAWLGPPAWSPDGTRLGWVSYDGIAGNSLVIVKPDGTGLRVLASGLGKSRPAWSPGRIPDALPPPTASPAGTVQAPSGDCESLMAVATQGWIDDPGEAQPAGSATAGPPPNGPIAVVRAGGAIDDSDIIGVGQGGTTLGVVRMTGTGGLTVAGSLAWSPDGRDLAYTVTVGSPARPNSGAFECEDLFIDPHSSDPIRLTHSGNDRGATAPAWSPDGTRIAYVTYVAPRSYAGDPWRPTGARGIEVRDLAANTVAELAACDSCRVAWSPDGTLLAAIANAQGHAGLTLYDSTSGAPTLLLPDVASDTMRWLADGTLDLVGRDSVGVNLYRVRTATRPYGIDTAINLSVANTWLFGADETALSPDGGSLAYQVSDRSGNVRLWAMSLAKPSNARPLNGTYSGDLLPAWSPDSTSIAFVGPIDTYVGDLLTVTADGGAVTRLDTITGIAIGSDHPAWAPAWP